MGRSLLTVVILALGWPASASANRLVDPLTSYNPRRIKTDGNTKTMRWRNQSATGGIAVTYGVKGEVTAIHRWKGTTKNGKNKNLSKDFSSFVTPTITRLTRTWETSPGLEIVTTNKKVGNKVVSWEREADLTGQFSDLRRVTGTGHKENTYSANRSNQITNTLKKLMKLANVKMKPVHLLLDRGTITIHPQKALSTKANRKAFLDLQQNAVDRMNDTELMTVYFASSKGKKLRRTILGQRLQYTPSKPKK